MPKNTEIKAKVRCLSDLINRAKTLSNEDGTVLVQRDVFYNCHNGRLKLRSITTKDKGTTGQLIFYQRPDKTGPKVSDFAFTPVPDPHAMDQVLSASLGSQGVVSKRRMLYMVGQTRIHIDKVDGLGDFMELEVEMKDDQSPEEGALIAHSLMERLGIDESDLITGAYHDLLKAKRAKPC